jgi:hypothetical protein
MIYSVEQTPTDIVIQALVGQSLKATEILDQLEQQQIKLSRQGLYDILRKLVSAEVVVKNGLKYSLNLMWTERIMSEFQRTSDPDAHHLQYLYQIPDKSSVTFTFNNPANADRFWNHVFVTLEKLHPPMVPLTTYFPHQWLYLSREQTEKYYFEIINKDTNHPVYYLIGGNTALDKKFKHDVSGKNIKVNLDQKMRLYHRADRHLTIQGNFIEELIVEKKFTNKVNKVYLNNTETNSAQEQLLEILKEPYKTKLKVTHNRNLANKLRKQLTKDFYVPKSHQLEI